MYYIFLYYILVCTDWLNNIIKGLTNKLIKCRLNG